MSDVWEGNTETPHNEFSGISHQFVHDEVKRWGQQEVIISHSSQGRLRQRTIRADRADRLSTVVVKEMDGTVIPSTTAFAFVYPAFF